MKILQIMPEFDLAGAERMCETLTLELKERGHQVRAVSLYEFHSAITDNLEKHGIRIHYLNKRKGPDPAVLPKLVHIFKEERPDIIHTHRYVCEYALPAAMLAGVAGRIHTVHNMADKESVQKWLQRFFYHRCHTVPVSISPRVQRSVEACYQLRAEQTPVIPNGVDLSKCIVKASYEQRRAEFHFLHIGRFMEQKNHVRLIAAFAALHRAHPGTTLTLLGEGPLFEKIRAQVLTLGLEDAVVMPGKVEDVFPYYKAADAFVLPSHYEGMPIALLEAMGCGLPVIASGVGGVTDLISDGESGLLCAPEEESIRQSMERLLLDEVLRERLGRCAQRKSARYSAKSMADGYEALYRIALARSVW